MKVPSSIRSLHKTQEDANRPLLAEVDKLLLSVKHQSWHYESRLKGLESFAVKVEAGRAENPSELEDFFACTLVVPNTSHLDRARDIVLQHFDLMYRRPESDNLTKKAADSFPFDDLRLYVRRKTNASLPPSPIDAITFEVQIKTFLQHAWGIATHDLNYKTSDVSWGKDRVVAHLKAAIEHIELSLQEAAELSKSNLLSKTDRRTSILRDVVAVLKAHWMPSELPSNVKLLGESVAKILESAEIPVSDLDELLVAAKSSGGGLPLNLSPHGNIVQLLIANRLAAVERALIGRGKRIKIIVTPEMTLPGGFPSKRISGNVIQL